MVNSHVAQAGHVAPSVVLTKIRFEETTIIEPRVLGSILSLSFQRYVEKRLRH